MSSHRLINNTLVNVLNTAISFIVAYAMTPIILHRIGAEEYGIWVFLSIFSVSGYFSLLDLGFQGAAIKYVAEFTASGQRERLAGVVNATVGFFSLAGFLGATVLWLFSLWLLPNVFQLPSEQVTLIQTLVAILSLGFFFQFPAIGFSSILEGLQRYDLVRGVGIAVTLAVNAAIVIWMTADNGLPFLVVTLVATGVAMALAYAWLVRRQLPDIQWRPWRIDRAAWSLMVRLSGKLFASKIVGLVFNNTDKILIGIFLTVTHQTDYDIVNKLHLILLSLLSIINQAILPAASALAAQRDQVGLQRLLLRATKYAVALVLPVWLFLTILPGQALGMWVGSAYTHLAPLVILYGSHIILTMLVGVSSTMLVGINKVGRVLKISLWAAGLNLGISLLTIQSLGILGLILGTVIAYFLSSAMYIAAGNRLFNIQGRDFSGQVIRPVILASAGSALVYALVLASGLQLSLITGISVLGIGYALFGALFLLKGVSQSELVTVAGWWQQVWKRSST